MRNIERLQNLKWQPGGHFEPLSQNKFFDPSTPYMRNIEHLKSQNGHQGAQKWPTGPGKGFIPRLLAILSHFRKISFLIQALFL